MSDEQIHDPKAYELTVTLQEDEELVQQAEYALPDGFVMPSAAPQGSIEPVTLVRKSLTTQFSGVPPALKGGADTAIAAIRLAWDFIEKGSPKASAEGASTAVLASADKAWDHYAAAQKFNSKTYRYRIRNGFGITVVAIDYVMRGTFKAQYDGKADVRDGDYMPNVEVYCSKIDLAWGWNVNAKAVLSHLSNVGPKGGRVVPDFYTTLNFNFWTFLCNHTDTYAYALRGDRGFVGKA